MIRPARTLVLALATTAIALLAAVPAAPAETPPLAPLGGIVFANAGRIISIKADGSERTVLTRRKTQLLRRNSLADIHHFGDSQPAISPDGKKLTFLRYLPAVPSQEVMIANRDGSGAKVVPGIGNDIQSLDWMGDGRLLLTTWQYRAGRRTTETFRVIALNPDSGKRRVLLSKKFFGHYNVNFIRAQETSPDRRLLLYTRDFGEDNDGEHRVQLRVLNLATGKDRVLVKGAEAGSFSPNGDRVAFTQMCADYGYSNCKSSGEKETGVWTIALDGSDRELIVSGDGEYSSPDWGPGGGYIIFASTRNFPAERQDSNEIYSVRSDGQCLTWLTNGSPESIMPSWAPETGVRTDPGAVCGDAGRKPLAEARPPKAIKSDPRPRYWAGPRVAGRLLSRIEGYAQDEFGNQLYRYGDCPYFESSDCRRAITLELARICSPIGEVRLPPRGKSTVQNRRGVKVKTHRTARGRLASTTLGTGLVKVGIGRSMLDVEEYGGKPIRLADHLALVDALRPVGKKLVPGSRLPAPALAKCRARKG